MQTCSYGHEEIVYTSTHCPLCEAHKEIDGVIEQFNKAESRIDELETELEALKGKQ